MANLQLVCGTDGCDSAVRRRRPSLLRGAAGAALLLPLSFSLLPLCWALASCRPASAETTTRLSRGPLARIAHTSPPLARIAHTSPPPLLALPTAATPRSPRACRDDSVDGLFPTLDWCPARPPTGRYRGGNFPEGDTICIVLTDGEPSDCRMPQIQSMLQNRAKNVYMTFCMCTEEDEVVAKYNECVDPVWGCDITDDFKSEQKEVVAAGGKLNYNKVRRARALERSGARGGKEERGSGPSSVVVARSPRRVDGVPSSLQRPRRSAPSVWQARGVHWTPHHLLRCTLRLVV